ncbi:MAG: type II toxin-antitoxin system RelE/ParE family toxin [Deltaproteobacteria bacterium]|nr:type II toxin-antitoxin system RelE/ParE family toxin [Deltaproteobacteria bacterium]
MRIVWTRLAAADLAAALAAIEAEHPIAADDLRDQISRRLKILRKQPRSGRMVPERAQEGLREIVLAPCRLVYEVAGPELFVLRFWHSRRDLTRSSLR